MMDVGRLDAQEERAGDRGRAKGQAKKARIARARAKKRRAGQAARARDEPDPVAKLAQEHGQGLRYPA